MLETLIASYISTLQKDMVIDYAKKQGTILDEKEATIITQFLKEHWKELYHQETACFKIIKKSLKEETYQKAVHLYKEAIKNYLK